MPERLLLPVTLADLSPRACWVCWQTQLRAEGDKKPTKIPYNPRTGSKARANDPKTWGTREQAEAHAPMLPKPFGVGGVGLEFAPVDDGRHLGGVDLDSCRNPETGVLEPWAMAWIERLASYTEISPSGTGAKVFFLYSLADRGRLRSALGTNVKGEPKHSALWAREGDDHPPAIEMHLSNRYFAVTDQRLPDTTDELREVPTADLLELIGVEGPAFVGQPADGGEEEVESPPPKRTKPKKRGSISGSDLSRSTFAFRVGAQARRDGATYEAMCEAIRTNPESAEWFAEKGQADNQRELMRIWEKTDPFTGELILSPGAPLGSARQFIGRHHTFDGQDGPIRTLHHQNATFYTYATSHYVENTPEEMRAALYRFLDGAKRFNDDGELVAFDPTKNRVANVLEATAAEAQLTRVRPPVWLGSSEGPPPAEIIACRNGLLHLPARKLLPHTPSYFTLNALGFDYQPEPPSPANWLRFLGTIWPGDAAAIGTLQEFFGLCLTNDTSHQKAMLIVGPKRSGKGTIARVLTELLGAANTCSPTLSSLSQNFGLAPLIGKYLAIISDARLSGKADQAIIAERILAVTGEDALTVDRKFREAWTGKLDVRFLVLTNELPRLTDSSGALASRFIILTMTRSFFGEEDRGLLGKLLPELPAILHWAIAGWERLRKRGHLIEPASSTAAAQEMADLGSPIGAFLRDCCTVDQGLSVRSAELYVCWCDWCREHGRDHFGTTQTFGRDLRAAVPGLKDTQPRADDGKRERYYEGLGLSQDYVLARAGTRAEALCSLSANQHLDPYPGGLNPYVQ